MIITVTGVPGAGKTTLCARLYQEFCSYQPSSGMVTEELRLGRARVGFVARRLDTGTSCLLAHVNFSGPRVGKYGVNVQAFREFVRELEPAVLASRFVVLDEVGKMELLVEEFEQLVHKLLTFYSREKVLLFSVHYTYNHPLCIYLREECYDYKFVLTKENREEVYRQLKELLKSCLLQ
ncbi:MAG: hypothetical protein GXO42_02685 [bacterium]|nr:hypothetical protein [bacterium]